MALRCGFVQSTNAFQVGQTPPPSVSLVVANDGAAAVNVTGVDLYVTDINANPLRAWSGNLPLPPIGFGQTTVVPAASGGIQGSITIGPMAITAPTAGAGSQSAAVPPQSTPSNPQGALPSQQQFFVRARVYGSDGSVTEATPAQFFVSYAVPPNVGVQGGFAMFHDSDNAALLAAVL